MGPWLGLSCLIGELVPHLGVFLRLINSAPINIGHGNLSLCQLNPDVCSGQFSIAVSAHVRIDSGRFTAAAFPNRPVAAKSARWSLPNFQTFKQTPKHTNLEKNNKTKIISILTAAKSSEKESPLRICSSLIDNRR